MPGSKVLATNGFDTNSGINARAIFAAQVNSQ